MSQLKPLKFILTCSVTTLIIFSCSSEKKNKDSHKKPPFKFGEVIVDTLNRGKKLPRSIGDYNHEFNDLVDLHLQAAIAKGVEPMNLRADTNKYVKDNELIRLPAQIELFRVDDLKHSIPYLVPQAARLLVIIAKDFRDSLTRKDLPLYRIVITSVTRTAEDLDVLVKRNGNAIQGSAHSYGTTFDISWKRFDKRPSHDSTQDVSVDRLKFILGQTLFNLKNRELCYVKHERKQACFHITVR